MGNIVKFQNRSDILVIDSIMGSGKSTYIIDQINQSPIQPFICVVPRLNEVNRYMKKVMYDTFTPCDKESTKLTNLKTLLLNKQNIVTTHALIQIADKEVVQLLNKGRYTCIIDEAIVPIEPMYSRFPEYNISSDDISSFLNSDVAKVLNTGLVKFTGKYNGIFEFLKKPCKDNNIISFASKNRLMYCINPYFFRAVKKMVICTYLFNGSILKSYFDLFRISYKVRFLYDNKLSNFIAEKELANRSRLYYMIEMPPKDDKLYNIGNPKLSPFDKLGKSQPLCMNWYKKAAEIYGTDKKEIKRMKFDHPFYMLRKNARKFLSETYKGCTGKDRMYTTYKTYKEYIEEKGFINSFIPCTEKATNDYSDRTILAYLVSLNMPEDYAHLFDGYNIKYNKDLWSTSEMLQWIWRSAIRNDKNIKLYIPSSRMRDLLGKWKLCNEIKGYSIADRMSKN